MPALYQCHRVPHLGIGGGAHVGFRSKKTMIGEWVHYRIKKSKDGFVAEAKIGNPCGIQH
jgi:hypothetical protein